MGIFSNFFKSQPLPEDEIEESENVMRKLREERQANTSRWVASIQDPGSLLPPTYHKVKIAPDPTIEDVDQREQPDSYVYTPPVEAMYPELDPSLVGASTAPAAFETPRPYSQQAQSAHNSAGDWVSKIFAEFTRQADLRNLDAQGSNLVISIHAPQYTEEEVSGGSYGQSQKVRFFKGYVSTTFWGMMLHGHHDKIDVYIVPAEAILQMTLTDIGQSGFSPFMTIDSKVENGRLEWHVDGATIVWETIPNLATELLNDLIKIASGNMQTSELQQQTPFVSSALPQGANLASSKIAAQSTTAAEIKASGVGSATPGATIPAGDPIAGFVSFEAAEALVAALTRDLTVLARLSDPLTTGAFRTGQTLDDGKQLSDMSTAMRTLHGQASNFAAQYKPKKR